MGDGRTRAGDTPRVPGTPGRLIRGGGPAARRAGRGGAVAAVCGLVCIAGVAMAKPPGAPVRADSSVTRADTSGRPRFTGTWKLSIDRSTFGKIPGGQPSARTDVIQHAEPRIRQVLYLLNGTRRDTTVYSYSTDGTPTVSVVDGRDIKSIARWEGRTLRLRSTTRLLVLDMSLDERWDLSPDARTLTMRRHVKYVLGEGDQTLVFERQ